MRKPVGPEKAILFTKLSVALTCAWPASITAAKHRHRLFNALWYLAFISAFALLFPLLAAVYEYRKDNVILGKAVCQTSAVVQVSAKMLICRSQQKQFQMLLYDMEKFCKNATTEERAVLQRYVDKYKYPHFVYVLWCYLTNAVVVVAPLYSPQKYPTDAVYPFPMEHQLLKSFIFFHQSLVGFQVSSGMSIDIQVALLLRYAAARFEILGGQLRKATTDEEINACVEKHDEVLSYMKRTHQSVRFLVLSTVATTIVAVMFGSLNFIADQPLILKGMFAVVVFSCSLELFMYAWPADQLMHLSNKIANDAYDSNWYAINVRIQMKILHIIQRAQKMETVQISGILPKLSLPYYAEYLYRSFSYFAALRIMVNPAPE